MAKANEKLVKWFNENYPVGTECVLLKDSGQVRTKVRGEAYIVGGHTAVAFFKGISGCYAIAGRVKPYDPQYVTPMPHEVQP